MVDPDKINYSNLFFHVPSGDVEKKLKRIGYKVDFNTSYYYIMRNSNFPFQRVSIPHNGLISLFTLKHILDAIDISFENYKKIR